jgi:phosphoserine phosphatase
MLRAVFFDVDGTLKVEPDPYRYLHDRQGFGTIARTFPQMYARGEISSDEWMRRDSALWRGIPRQRLVAWLREVPYVPGAVETIRSLRARGVAMVAVSSGLQLHADLVRAELGLDETWANELQFVDDICTGEIVIRVHEAGKAEVVQEIMARRGLRAEECLAVGDAESDVGMFECCRLGVAVCPLTDSVRAAAGLVFEEADLTALLVAVDHLFPGWLPAGAESLEDHEQRNHPGSG